MSGGGGGGGGLLPPNVIAMAAAPALIPLDALNSIVPIESLKPFDKGINCRFIVLSREEVKDTKEGSKVYTFLVADGTGSILATLWDEIGSSVYPGDIIHMTCAFVTLFKGHLRLACKVGQVHKIGSFRMLFKEHPNISDVKWIPSPDDHNILIPERLRSTFEANGKKRHFYQSKRGNRSNRSKDGRE